MDQLVSWSTVGRDDSAQRSYLADVPYQSARIDIPYHRNLVPVQIEMRRFSGTPIRRDL